MLHFRLKNLLSFKIIILSNAYNSELPREINFYRYSNIATFNLENRIKQMFLVCSLDRSGVVENCEFG